MPILLTSGNVNAEPTLADLIEETTSALMAWVRNQEQVTWLTSVMGDDALTISVADASQLSRGLAEVGFEQVYITNVNSVENTATLAAFGRGYNGTVAEQHEALDRVVASPLFPRIRVAEAINQTISSLQGKIPVVAHIDIPYQVGQLSYTLPDDCTEVLGVEQRSWGTSQVWTPVLRWRHNSHAAAGLDAGTNSIDLLEPLHPANEVRVTYAAYPSLFAATEDTLSSTGLENSARDILVFGAAARMVAFVDAGRLEISSASADTQDTNVQVGSASALSRYFYQLHAARVDEERLRILSRHNQYVNFPGA